MSVRYRIENLCSHLILTFRCMGWTGHGEDNIHFRVTTCKHTLARTLTHTHTGMTSYAATFIIRRSHCEVSTRHEVFTRTPSPVVRTGGAISRLVPGQDRSGDNCGVACDSRKASFINHRHLWSPASSATPLISHRPPAPQPQSMPPGMQQSTRPAPHQTTTSAHVI